MTIDVYTWPTPNGHKVHIMLHEAEIAHNIIPINIQEGDQFKPDFLKISPNNKMPAIVDPDGPDGQADLGVRIRRLPDLPCEQDREVHACRRA